MNTSQANARASNRARARSPSRASPARTRTACCSLTTATTIGARGVSHWKVLVLSVKRSLTGARVPSGVSDQSTRCQSRGFGKRSQHGQRGCESAITSSLAAEPIV
jgi:hypothetical protein